MGLLIVSFLSEVIYSPATGLETVLTGVVVNGSLIKIDLLSIHSEQILYEVIQNNRLPSNQKMEEFPSEG